MFNFSIDSKELEKDKILILVDGWGFHKFFYTIIKKFIPSGFGYIHYSYSDNILDKDAVKTRDNILQLISSIEKDVNNLILIKQRTFYLYGQSLGGLFCMIIADKINIKKVMLVAPGCNLAESFWLGEYTQKVRKDMVNDFGQDLENLKQIWKDVSPDYYFKDNGLKSNFNIILSTKDKAIPTSNGEKLIELLKQRNISSTLALSNLPHKLLLLKEMVFVGNFKKWIVEN